tara:strand:+ start:5066 stop:5323 length:258 start_codon:yes stop_codon:yes gene_type:complete
MKNKNHTLRRLLKEFQFEQLSREPYRDGELVLEYVEGYEVPRYVIFFESGNLESENSNGEIVVELDSRFFDAKMADTVLNYIMTR